MRLAIDGRAFSSPAGGVRRYVSELVRALLALEPAPDIVVCGAGVDAIVPDGTDRVEAAWSPPSNAGWAAVGLPLTLRRARFDVFHAPAYTAPLWGARPLVVTLHDVSYARHPEWYPHANDPMRRAFYRASARRANRVITDSSFSRREIEAAYGLRADRIDVVPLAASAIFTASPDVPREPFVLHVGDLHTRRNLPMLLDAVIDLRRSQPGAAGCRLVLAGTDRGLLAPLTAAAAKAGAPDALEYAGTPSDEALRDLYRRASVFAYPSRYEGFGLPVLEAMACGAPVVATSAGAVPEVTGDAAPCIDPDDARAWRDALVALITSPARRAMASDASVRRAAVFSWAETARLTRDTYARVVNGPQ